MQNMNLSLSDHSKSGDQMAEAVVPENLMQAAKKRGEAGEAVIDLIKRSGMDISTLPSLRRSLETMLSTYKDDHALVSGAGNMLIKWLETKLDKTDSEHAPKLRNLIGEIELIVKRESKEAESEAQRRAYEREAKRIIGIVPEKKVTEEEWAAELKNTVQERYGPVLERNKKSAEDMLKDAEKLIKAKGVIVFGQVDDSYLSAVEELAQQLKPRRMGEGEGEQIITRPETPELEKRVEREFGGLLKRVGRSPGDFLDDVFRMAQGEYERLPNPENDIDYNNAVQKYFIENIGRYKPGKGNIVEIAANALARLEADSRAKAEPTIVAKESSTPYLEAEVRKDPELMRLIKDMGKDSRGFLEDVRLLAEGNNLEPPTLAEEKLSYNRYLQAVQKYVLENVFRFIDEPTKGNPVENTAKAFASLEAESKRNAERAISNAKAAPSETYIYDLHIGKENTGLRVVTNKPLGTLITENLSRINLENADEVRKALEPLGIVAVYHANDKERKDAITDLAKRLYGLAPLQTTELAEVRPPARRKRA